jgi:hypothetical protein
LDKKNSRRDSSRASLYIGTWLRVSAGRPIAWTILDKLVLEHSPEERVVIRRVGLNDCSQHFDKRIAVLQMRHKHLGRAQSNRFRVGDGATTIIEIKCKSMDLRMIGG